jgi:hypothetical protein
MKRTLRLGFGSYVIFFLSAVQVLLLLGMACFVLKLGPILHDNNLRARIDLLAAAFVLIAGLWGMNIAIPFLNRIQVNDTGIVVRRKFFWCRFIAFSEIESCTAKVRLKKATPWVMFIHLKDGSRRIRIVLSWFKKSHVQCLCALPELNVQMIRRGAPVTA